MSQRRREDDEWVWSIGRMVALLLAMALFYPPFRQNIPPEGLIFLGILVFLVLGGSLVSLVRTGASRPHSLQLGLPPNGLESSFWTKPEAPTYLPQSTYELLRQLREGDASICGRMLGLVYQKLDYRVTRRTATGMALVIERGGLCTGLQFTGPNKGKVGVRLVREFRGALTTAELDKGILITFDGYTRQAKKLADSCGIELLEEPDLARLLDATRAGHDTTILAVIPNARRSPAPSAGQMALTAAESR
jgi:hypothetical protein